MGMDRLLLLGQFGQLGIRILTLLIFCIPITSCATYPCCTPSSTCVVVLNCFDCGLVEDGHCVATGFYGMTCDPDQCDSGTCLDTEASCSSGDGFSCMELGGSWFPFSSNCTVATTFPTASKSPSTVFQTTVPTSNTPSASSQIMSSTQPTILSLPPSTSASLLSPSVATPQTQDSPLDSAYVNPSTSFPPTSSAGCPGQSPPAYSCVNGVWIGATVLIAQATTLEGSYNVSGSLSISVGTSLILQQANLYIEGDVDLGSTATLALSSSQVSVQGNLVLQAGSVVTAEIFSLPTAPPLSISGCLQPSDATLSIYLSANLSQSSSLSIPIVAYNAACPPPSFTSVEVLSSTGEPLPCPKTATQENTNAQLVVIVDFDATCSGPSDAVALVTMFFLFSFISLYT